MGLAAGVVGGGAWEVGVWTWVLALLCAAGGAWAIFRRRLDAPLWIVGWAFALGVMRAAPPPHVDPGAASLRVHLMDDGTASDWGTGVRHRARVRVGPDAGQPILLRLRRPCGREGDQVDVEAEPEGLRPSRNWGVPSDRARLRAMGVVRVWTQTRSGPCRLVAGPGPMAAFRRHVRDHMSGTLSEVGRPVVAALALGDRDLPPRLREQVADAGLAHLLVVSGFHLSLVAAATRWVLNGALRRRLAWVDRGNGPRWAARGVVLLVGLYVLMVGAGPSALRAFVMVSLALAGPQLGRTPDPLSLWVATALALVWFEPRWAGQLGFQLSVVAVAGVLFVGPALERLGPNGWRGRLWSLLTPSLGAGLLTLPLLSLHLHRVSWVGFLVTPWVGPWVCFGLVPAAGLGALCSPLAPGLAAILWTWADVQAQGFVGLVSALSELPLAKASLTRMQAIGISLAGLAVAHAAWLGRARMAALIALGGAAWLGVAPVLERPAQPSLVIFSVEHGSSAVLRLPAGQAVLFDVASESAARHQVLPSLLHLGVRRLDGLVLSHADSDHTGGLAWLRSRVPMGWVWQGPSFVPTPGTVRVQEFQHRAVGEANLRVRSAWLGGKSDNDRSLAVEVELPGCRILLPGDLEAAAETRSLDRNQVKPVDVLVVPHHGSHTSSTEAWLRALKPRWGVISTGGRHQPDEDVLERYRRLGIPVHRTDRHGAVEVRCGPDGPRIRTRRRVSLMLERNEEAAGEGADSPGR